MMVQVEQLKEMEVFFNFKDICESILQMELEQTCLLFEKQVDLAFPNLEMKKEAAQVFLTSMNRSLYNYILYKRDISLHICCCQNSILTHKCEDKASLIKIGHSILQMYYNELNTTTKSNLHITRAKQFIQENLSEPLTLEQVANHVFLCKAYLSEIFPQYTGLKFSEYVTLQRVEYAKQLLLYGGQSILEISQQCGFSSAAYFSSVFTRITGKSPRKFRQQFLKYSA